MTCSVCWLSSGNVWLPRGGRARRDVDESVDVAGFAGISMSGALTAADVQNFAGDEPGRLQVGDRVRPSVSMSRHPRRRFSPAGVKAVQELYLHGLSGNDFAPDAVGLAIVAGAGNKIAVSRVIAAGRLAERVCAEACRRCGKACRTLLVRMTIGP